MLIVSILLYGLGLAIILATFVPFSPMTLKLYMPSREAMIWIHRHRHYLWGIGLLSLATLLVLALAGLTSIGWAWAVAITLVALTVLFWSNYVPLIMRLPPRKNILSVDEASHLIMPDADILGVVVNGEARAYSRKEVTRPHLVFDDIGGEAMAVTYCILCNSAIGFRAELDGKPMRFSALTAYNNNIIYYDRKRRNYIQQLDGAVVAGPDTGRKLDAVPITITKWESWRQLHPDTLYVQLPPTGLRDNMMTWMLDWMIALPGLSQRKSPWHPVTNRIDDRLPAMSQIVGVEFRDVRRAYSLDYVRKHQVINDEIGGEPIVIFYDAERDTGAVFSRRANGQVLSFQPTTEAVAVETSSQTRWDVRGVELSPQGDNVDRHLDPLPHFGKTFWFSWYMFKDGTEVIAS